MWSSRKEVKITEMSYKVSSVMDKVEGSHLLRRSPKVRQGKMTEKQEDLRETNDAPPRDVIPLPWVDESKKDSDENNSVDSSSVSGDLSSVSGDLSHKKVVVDLQWFSNDEAKAAGRPQNTETAPEGGNQADGIKASLRLVDADRLANKTPHSKGERAGCLDSLNSHTGFCQSQDGTLEEVSNTTQGARTVHTDAMNTGSITPTQTGSQHDTVNSATSVTDIPNTTSVPTDPPTQTRDYITDHSVTDDGSSEIKLRQNTEAMNVSSDTPAQNGNPDIANSVTDEGSSKTISKQNTETVRISSATPTQTGNYNTADLVTNEDSSRTILKQDTVTSNGSSGILPSIVRQSYDMFNTGDLDKTIRAHSHISTITDRSRNRSGTPHMTDFDTNSRSRNRSVTPHMTDLDLNSRSRNRSVTPYMTDFDTNSISSVLTRPTRELASLRVSAESIDIPSLRSYDVKPYDTVDYRRESSLTPSNGLMTSLTVGSRDSRRHRDLIVSSESDATSHGSLSVITEDATDESRFIRDASPFTRAHMILTDITEDHERWGDVTEEAELLTDCHGAGVVMSPMIADDVPETPVPRMDHCRRGRSVSVMRKLLSEGGGQFSRETTPMSDLRRRFKFKMKVASLHEAVTSGDAKAVAAVLDGEEFDIDATDERQRTALHMAAERGSTDIVTLLIQEGCKINPADVDKRTPLHCAVESGEVGVVAALLEAGAQVDAVERTRGRTPIHLATVANSLDILKLLLQPLIDDPWEGRRILAIADKDGRTLLHMTAHHGLQEATSLLLSAGAEVNAKDISGNTPMHAVILTRLRRKERLCAPLLEVLLDSGGDVEGDAAAEGGSEAGTLMHAAASVGCLDCLRVLVSRSAQMEIKDFFGKTPLQVAIEEEHTKAVAFLLENKASMEEVDSRGQRALHHAIMTDSTEVVDYLIMAGADKDGRDRDGKTYFQFAMLKRRYQALDSLVKNGVVHVDDQRAIQYCACVGNQTALDVLLSNGYNINETDSDGRTALHHAIASGHEPLVLYLLANGCSTRRADNNGATPLHYAVRWGGSDALLRRLVKQPGNVGAVDRLGRTPLHYAASKSAIMSDMYILLNNGAPLNPKDDRGLTPLHLAARLGNESLVRILLDNDARHDIRDCDNFLPIDHAKEKGHKCIIKRLEAFHIKKEREKDVRLNFYVGKKEEEEKEEVA